MSNGRNKIWESQTEPNATISYRIETTSDKEGKFQMYVAYITIVQDDINKDQAQKLFAASLNHGTMALSPDPDIFYDITYKTKEGTYRGKSALSKLGISNPDEGCEFVVNKGWKKREIKNTKKTFAYA